jgi:hypothetical protein
MKHRWDFFKEADSSFGLFYPMHYVVAGFDTYERAQHVARACREGGFAEDDVAAASGNYIVNHVESQREAGWVDRVMAGISRIIGTEAGYIEDDIKLARRGGSFVFIYMPDHDRAERASALLRRLHPIFARRYQNTGVVRLMYPPQSTL